MENKYKVKKNAVTSEGTVVNCRLASTTTVNNRKEIRAYKVLIQVPNVERNLVAVVKFTEFFEPQKRGFGIKIGGIRLHTGMVAEAKAAINEVKNLGKGPWLPFLEGDKVTVIYNSAKPKKCIIQPIENPSEQVTGQEEIVGQ